MLKSYKYQLRPTAAQKTFFNKSFGCARLVYNWGLALKKETYAKDKTSLSYVDIAKRLTLLKKEEQYSFLNEVSSECLQQSLRNMDIAFQRFFRHKSDFPKFKSKHKSRNSYKAILSVQVDLLTNRVKLPKIGWVKFYANQTFVGKVNSVTVSKSCTGKYYVSVLVENGESLPAKQAVESSGTVGIDLGLTDFAVTSDGVKIPNPRFYKEFDERIKRLCRIHSRRKKGSNRRKRIQHKINKLHERKSNLINNFLYHVTKHLYSDNQTVVIEDLAVKNMMQNHKLSRTIGEVCWGRFISILKYKADWLGKNVIVIGRFEPSSKTCSCCGYKHDALKLSDRHWECPCCGVRHDRDFNAAVNIKRIGLGDTQYSPTACGFNGRGGGGYEAGEASKCTLV